MDSESKMQEVSSDNTRIERESLAKLFLLGINHRTLPIAKRECFAEIERRRTEVLHKILSADGVFAEVVLLSTCNRVEVVVSSELGEEETCLKILFDIFSSFAGLPMKDFQENFYFFTGTQVVRHVFRVCAGLDSMVLGEPQILGQVKAAYRQSAEVQAVGSLLSKTYERAFAVAKLVRTDTAIGKLPVSICYAARELAKQIFGELGGLKLLVFGTGDTAKLALKHFLSSGITAAKIISRDSSRAELVAAEHGVEAISFSGLSLAIAQADILVGATLVQGNGDYVLRAKQLTAELRTNEKPQLAIDLGVPRNFDPLIAELPESFLYNIDDLDQVIQAGSSAREEESVLAEALVEREVEKFSVWLKSRSADRIIHAVVELEERFRKEEISRTLRRLRREGFNEEQCVKLEAILGDFSQALIAKTFHRSFQELKNKGDEQLLKAFTRLFLD